MKNAIWVLMSGMIGILVLSIVIAIEGNMNRSVELQTSLSTAMESAMQEVMRDEEPRDEKLLELCKEQLQTMVDSKTDMILEVYRADVEKGIFGIKAKGIYMHTNGEEGDVEWQRIVICDKEESATMSNCEVQFYVDKDSLMRGKECYKRISVPMGTRINEPVSPKRTEMEFVGWRDCNDYIADFSGEISENRVYYATWK